MPTVSSKAGQTAIFRKRIKRNLCHCDFTVIRCSFPFSIYVCAVVTAVNCTNWYYRRFIKYSLQYSSLYHAQLTINTAANKMKPQVKKTIHYQRCQQSWAQDDVMTSSDAHKQTWYLFDHGLHLKNLLIRCFFLRFFKTFFGTYLTKYDSLRYLLIQTHSTWSKF
jgi:hypothetical protein